MAPAAPAREDAEQAAQQGVSADGASRRR